MCLFGRTLPLLFVFCFFWTVTLVISLQPTSSPSLQAGACPIAPPAALLRHNRPLFRCCELSALFSFFILFLDMLLVLDSNIRQFLDTPDVYRRESCSFRLQQPFRERSR